MLSYIYNRKCWRSRSFSSWTRPGTFSPSFLSSSFSAVPFIFLTRHPSASPTSSAANDATTATCPYFSAASSLSPPLYHVVVWSCRHYYPATLPLPPPQRPPPPHRLSASWCHIILPPCNHGIPPRHRRPIVPAFHHGHRVVAFPVVSVGWFDMGCVRLHLVGWEGRSKIRLLNTTGKTSRIAIGVPSDASKLYQNHQLNGKT